MQLFYFEIPHYSICHTFQRLSCTLSAFNELPLHPLRMQHPYICAIYSSLITSISRCKWIAFVLFPSAAYPQLMCTPICLETIADKDCFRLVLHHHIHISCVCAPIRLSTNAEYHRFCLVLEHRTHALLVCTKSFGHDCRR